VGYLLGESKKQDPLKDTAMLKRLNDIASFPDEGKTHIIYNLNALVKNVKLKAIYNNKARLCRALLFSLLPKTVF
jgi:hypothetical protein